MFFVTNIKNKRKLNLNFLLEKNVLYLQENVEKFGKGNFFLFFW